MITRNLAVESFMFSLSSSNIQPMSHPLGLEGGEVVSFDTLKGCGGFLLGVTLTETNIAMDNLSC